MSDPSVARIAQAVLYEGYMLYPYRPSAIKNRHRFNFGVVYPRAYSELQGGGEAWTMQTECLVLGTAESLCSVQVRFLRAVNRSIGKRAGHPENPNRLNDAVFENVESRQAVGTRFQSWQEAVEEQIEVTPFSLGQVDSQPMPWPFRLCRERAFESIREESGEVQGILERERKSLSGQIDIETRVVIQGLYRLRVGVSNATPFDSLAIRSREDVLSASLISAHTVLDIADGEFLSMTDPPSDLREAAKKCQNIGTWPILVGKEGERNTLLSSPIILPDYPEVAPESPGDLFDGTEIDEILSLRILTMTEEEKREMRESDERARRILERTEDLPDEHWAKLHGAWRGLRAAKEVSP